jgi:hypothetical protein
MVLSACVTPSGTTKNQSMAAPEEIYILHSIREQYEPIANCCSSTRTGFEPFPYELLFEGNADFLNQFTKS